MRGLKLSTSLKGKSLNGVSIDIGKPSFALRRRAASHQSQCFLMQCCGLSKKDSFKAQSADGRVLGEKKSRSWQNECSGTRSLQSDDRMPVLSIVINNVTCFEVVLLASVPKNVPSLDDIGQFIALVFVLSYDNTVSPCRW